MGCFRPVDELRLSFKFDPFIGTWQMKIRMLNNAVALLFNDFSQKIRMLNNVVTTMLFPPSRGPSQIPESKHTVLIKLKPHRLMSKLFSLLITATIDLVNSNHNPEPPSIHSTPATIHSHHHP